MTAANVGAGTLGYAFQILMGRMLDVTEFALLTSLFASGMVLSAPFSAMLMIVSRRVAITSACGDAAGLKRIAIHAFLSFGILVAAILMLGHLMSVQIATWLNLPSPLYALCLVAIPCFTALITITNGFLQGLQKFFFISAVSVSAVLVKIVVALALISIGMGVIGAVGGLFFSNVFIVVAGIFWVSKATKLVSANLAATVTDPIVPKTPIISVILSNIAVIGVCQGDVILVNNFLFPEQAGFYAAAAVLGKAALYLPAGVAFVLYPLVASNDVKKQSSNNYLYLSILLALAGCLGISITYFFIGYRLIEFFYGPAYTSAGEILCWYGFAFMPVSLVVVLENFMIARGKVVFGWVLLIIGPLFFILFPKPVDIFHFLRLISVLGVIWLVVGGLWMFREICFTKQTSYSS